MGILGGLSDLAPNKNLVNWCCGLSWGGGGYGAAVQIMFMSHVCPHSVNPFGPETFHPEALNP